MTTVPRSPAPTRRVLAAAAGALALLAGCGISGGSTNGSANAARTPFPAVASHLTARQRRLVTTLRAEYASNPASGKYTLGHDEPWCADFVSWVERSDGTPLRNPNTGGWRIPGTMTLLDVFRTRGVWHPAASGYRPVLGDIAIYDGNGPFGQHTNYVLSLRGDQLTTLGGNEPGGVRISTHALDAGLTVLGFAHLG